MEYLFLSFQFQPVYIFKRSLLQTAYSWTMHFYLFCLSLCLSTFLLTIKRGGEGPINSARPTVMLSSVFISCFIRYLCLYPPGPSMPPPLAWTVRWSVWLFRAAPSVGREGPASQSQWSPCSVGLGLLPWDPWRVSSLWGDAGSRCWS